MTLNAKKKMRHGLIGMAIGDAFCKDDGGKASAAALTAMCSIRAISSSKGKLDDFLAGLAKEMVEWKKSNQDSQIDRLCDPTTDYICGLVLGAGEDWHRSGTRGDSSPGPMPRAIPIGAFFQSDMPMVIEFARGGCSITHEDTTPQCATVAAGLLVTYATIGIPVGVWAHELSNFVSGIDPDVMHCLKNASLLAGKPTPPDQAIASLGGGTDAASVIATSLYCCMRSPSNFQGAITLAKMTKNKIGACVTGSIVGACMGARFGDSIGSDLTSNIEVMDKLLADIEILTNASIIVSEDNLPAN